MIGVLGELHPKWQQQYDLPQAPIVFELQLEAISARSLPKHQDIAKFPAVTRDLALIVDNSVNHDAVIATLKQATSPITKQISLFDQYRGGNMSHSKKSLAFRVLMQETERTLTDQAVEQEMQNLLQAAQSHLGATLR
jgi:phenylalanyl-tRNA synthetase beta chain